MFDLTMTIYLTLKISAELETCDVDQNLRATCPDPNQTLVLYRALRPDESCTNGLISRVPEGTATLKQHLRSAGTNSAGVPRCPNIYNNDPFLSFTTDPERAKKIALEFYKEGK